MTNTKNLTDADKLAALRAKAALAADRMGYADLMAALTAEHGTPFVMTHTGGNCWSIVARVTIGDRECDVYIGDHNDPLTAEGDRAQVEALYGPVGFGVCVNELALDDDGEWCSVAEIAEQCTRYATVAEVPAMVRLALVEAASGELRVEL